MAHACVMKATKASNSETSGKHRRKLERPEDLADAQEAPETAVTPHSPHAESEPADPGSAPHLLTPLAELWPAAAAAQPPPPKTSSAKPFIKPPAPAHATTFVLYEPDARQVAVAGDFNDWSPGATPMQRDADARWVVRVALTPGRHQYKFIVDGQWIPDPLAGESVRNGHGTFNSVVEVRG